MTMPGIRTDRPERRASTQVGFEHAVERSSMTTTLTAPTARAAVVEQTRLRALALQIEFVLRHTNLEDWVPQLHHGLENRWVEAIGILGLEPDGRARSMLYLEIDWARHDTERNSGRFIVCLAKDRHPEGATDLVTATTGWFRDVAVLRQLRIHGRVLLTEEVQRDRKLRARVFRELGLRRMGPIRWVEGPRENILEGDDPELLELNVSCTVVY
jgi:hypothetical protein